MSKLTETFIDEERKIAYTCSATWDFLERLERKQKDLIKCFNSLMSGGLPASVIKDAISCSLIDINGEKVNDAQRDEAAIEIIQRFGIQEASLLAREMVSRAMVGDIKKSQMEAGEKVKNLLEQLLLSPSMPFWKRGSAWAILLTTFGLAAWSSFKLLTMHI